MPARDESFGRPSESRRISFSIGRTVYDPDADTATCPDCQMKYEVSSDSGRIKWMAAHFDDCPVCLGNEKDELLKAAQRLAEDNAKLDDWGAF